MNVVMTNYSNLKKLAESLRAAADELEATAEDGRGKSVPDELQGTISGEVYDVAAEGWHTDADYVIAFDNETDELRMDSRNVKSLSELDGYQINYVAWGDNTDVESSSVELCVSKTDE